MAQFEFPLAWPTGQPRTPGVDRQWSKFGKKRDHGWGRDDLTVHQAANRLVSEVCAFTRRGYPWRIDPDCVVVSTNLRVLKSTNMPDSRQSAPSDPGVAVYFDLDGQPYCLPCDKWATVAGNLAAVAAHLNAIRGIEHYAWHVSYTDQRGRRRRRTFFIGSSSTWTRARERAALAAARAFRAAYEHWVKHGGVHPLDTGKHEWSARAA